MQLENHAKALDEELHRERQLRTELDKAKRKLEAEVDEQKDMLEEKRSKVEELNRELIKFQEERVQYHTK